MNSALEDEFLSINAIYGPDTLVQSSSNLDICLLKIPSTDATLRLSFPESYPNDAPTVLGPESSGSETRKGAANKMTLLARDALVECFRPGEPCIFDVLEQISGSLASNIEAEGPHSPMEESSEPGQIEAETESQSTMHHLEPADWTVSDVITEKKSVFVARVARVDHPDQARAYVRHLTATDKKVAKATHNITAWRIKGSSGVVYQDCDDDGEAAAGGRLLHLLQIMDIWGAVVVVSRWYGGVKLGPDRFRLINAAARDCLVKGRFDKETQK